MTTVQEGALLLIEITSILTRCLTGHTPFRWIAMFLLVTEALIQQLLKSLWLAAEDYRMGFSQTWREVRCGVSPRSNLVVMQKENQA